MQVALQGLHLLMIFMRDHYVHADCSGLCLLMIFMKDHFVPNTQRPLLALQGHKCCETDFSQCAVTINIM